MSTATQSTSTARPADSINAMAAAQFNAQLNLAQTVCDNLIARGIVPMALHIAGVRPAIEIECHSEHMPLVSECGQVQVLQVRLGNTQRTQYAAEYRGCVLLWQVWQTAPLAIAEPQATAH